MKPNLDWIFRAYAESDYLLQQKVKVVTTICFSILVLLPVAIAYTIIIEKTTAPGVLIPEFSAFLIFIGALWLLAKGHFLFASHLILITSFSAAWMVVFMDPGAGGLVAKLDTIAFVLAALTMTPLIVNEKKWPIPVYFLINFIVLTIFSIAAESRFREMDFDGLEFWMDNSIAILFIGIISYKVFSINKKALDKANRDIQQRLEAEKALTNARLFMESSLASIPDGVLLFNEDVRLSYMNPVFLEWVGRNREDLAGKTVDEVSAMFLEPMTARRITESVVERVQAGEPVIGDEIELLDAKGRYRPVSLTVAAIFDKTGAEIIGGVVILVDLTERRLLETRLRQSQKMEAIGTLAGGIAHDFNNILSAIMGNTELLLYQSQLDASGKKRLDNIYQASERAKELVGQILLFSRKSEQERKPVALRLIMKETIKLLKASFPSTIEIRLDMTDESIQVFADATQIHQILMNLCTNAHHAMLHTGGMLTLELSTLDVAVGSPSHPPGLSPGSWVRMCVKDTGEGMSPEIQERIFEPYFSTKEKGVGTGLGLAVVHGIVQSYGGMIDVFSKPGEGTRFTVFLPRMHHFIETDPNPVKPLPLGNHERILFVDDEIMLIEIEKDTLEKLNYRVDAAASAHDALAIFSSSPESYDLVITDMTMPKMTGDVLAREMLKIRPDIAIILCTGFSETINRDKALAMGISAFLMKPFKIQDLAETIQAVLHG